MSPDTLRTALFIFGTRPEAIKLAPVIRVFQRDPRYRTLVAVTGQHRTMLDQVLEFFELKPDIDLHLMTPNQSLSDLAARAIAGCAEVYARERPDVIFVQGDTTTAFAAAFAGFQCRVPVAHIEAGLRSFRKDSPFPEEMNRMLISDVADLHFPPLASGRDNLANEGVRENVFVVGNTVVDALLLGLELIESRGDAAFYTPFFNLDFTRRIALVTAHRRESFGAPMERICAAIRDLVESDSTLEVVYPVHLNPNVRATVHRVLGEVPRVHLIEPLDYAHFIWLMSKAALIITDSGGVQEEAPTLGIPVLVVRDVTERGEGVEAGCAELVGSDRERIVRTARAVLATGRLPGRELRNPYGDGHASERILELTARYLGAS